MKPTLELKHTAAPPGRHLLADLSGVPADRLRDSDGIMAHLKQALAAAGFHVVKELSHRFDGGGEGFTGVCILSESHAVIHTYPEFGYLALDVFSCGDADSEAVLEAMQRYLNPSSTHRRTVARSAEEPRS